MGGIRILWGRYWKRGRVRIGATHDVVFSKVEGTYLERFVLWLGLPTVRIHRFHRSDDDRALHDHPWWFITFPLGQSYCEEYFDEETGDIRKGFVRPWCFHFRRARYRHRVILMSRTRPWTFVITGPKNRQWGFWPEPDLFIHHNDWEQYCADNGLI